MPVREGKTRLVLGRRMKESEALLIAQIGVQPVALVRACRALHYKCVDCGEVVPFAELGDSCVEPTCQPCWEQMGLINEHNDGHHDGSPAVHCPYCAAETTPERNEIT